MIESFLFLFTGIIGIVTIGLMITSYKSNPFYNFFLLVIITLVSYRFLIHGSFELGLQSFIKADKGSNSILFLITVPCFYLYNKNLALQTRTYNLKDLKHFIFIGFLYFINTSDIVQDSFIFHFGPVTNFILVGVFILFYLIQIFKLLKKHIWFKKDLPINNSHFNLVKKWTVYLFSLNTIAAVGVILSVYLEATSGASLSGKSLSILLLISWLFIYFKILTSPEILYGLPILNKRLLKFDNTTKSKTNEEPISSNANWLNATDANKRGQDLKLQKKIASNITSYALEVDRLSSEKLIFRNQKATQTDLAKVLGVPTSHVVFLFKYHSKITFSEYRMHSRIKDAIGLIKDGYLEINTFESLAFKTGFASYNPFFSAFKKVTNHSPQEYLKNSLNPV